MGQNEPLHSRGASAGGLQDLPLPLVGLRKTYGHGHLSTRHSHPRHQLIYAVSGLMMAQTDSMTWAIPSGTGLIVPAGTEHETRMVGEVRLQSLYIDPDARHATSLAALRTISVSPLLAALIDSFSGLGNPVPATERSECLSRLILLELADAPDYPLALPLPDDPRLRRQCEAMIATPGRGLALDDRAAAAGMSRRSFTRRFQAETGMSFGVWCQRMRCQVALQQLARGVHPAQVAQAVGYASPYALRAMMARHLERPGQPRRI